MTSINFKELPIKDQDKLIESLKGLPFLENTIRLVLEDIDPMIVCDYSPFIDYQYTEAVFVSLLKIQSKKIFPNPLPKTTAS